MLWQALHCRTKECNQIKILLKLLHHIWISKWPPSYSWVSLYALFAVDGDPHFMIELPDRDDALCFNINGRPGTILNLVRDPKSGQAWVLLTQSSEFYCEKVEKRQTQTHYFQALWWTAKLSARRKLFRMVTSTPTLAVLVSSTRSWGWGSRWAHRTSQSSMMANRSSCWGLIRPLSKKPSE